MNAADLALRGTLGGVMLHALDPERYPLDKFEPAEGRALRWPSGIAGVEDRVDLEGFYGFTTIQGKQKLGKSIAAFASAGLAVNAGIRVIYVDAELDAMQLTRRIVRFGGADWYAQARDHFVMRMLTAPCSLTAMVSDLALHVGLETERVLVVLDSVTRIAQRVETASRLTRAGRSLDYWTAMRLVIDWCATIRRLAPTQIGVLVTSEENGKGGTKGQQLEYAGDMVMRVKGTPGSKVVELDIPYSREGGEGELGMYRNDWQHTRFERCERVEARDPNQPVLM